MINRKDPITVQPQPNKKENVHHEGHEEHEVRSLNFPNPSCPS
jgi:hypothetical protein